MSIIGGFKVYSGTALRPPQMNDHNLIRSSVGGSSGPLDNES